MKVKFYKKTLFWVKLEQTLSLIGGIGITTAGFEKAPYWVFIAFGASAVAAKIMFIWIDDKDNDGIIDWFHEPTKKDETPL